MEPDLTRRVMMWYAALGGLTALVPTLAPNAADTAYMDDVARRFSKPWTIGTYRTGTAPASDINNAAIVVDTGNGLPSYTIDATTDADGRQRIVMHDPHFGERVRMMNEAVAHVMNDPTVVAAIDAAEQPAIDYRAVYSIADGMARDIEAKGGNAYWCRMIADLASRELGAT